MANSFTVFKVDHTGICMTSLQAALPFWIDVLGCKLLRQGEIGAGSFLAQVCNIPNHGLRFAMLDIGGQKIELCEYFGAERDLAPPGIEAVGVTHLCFALDDLDAALSAMEPHGYLAAGEPQILTAGPRTGTRVVFVSNADNIHLELMQPPR